MYDFNKFDLPDMTLVAAQLRKVGRACSTMEHACQQAARFFYEEFVDGMTNQQAFVLCRCYKTHPYAQLPPALQCVAKGTADQVPSADTQCLTLLGTYGDDLRWRERQGSVAHQTIALHSEQTLANLPMVAEFTLALGLPLRLLVHPDPAILVAQERQGFGVFHVKDAVDSPHIPAQTGFVLPLKVKSAVGFGFVTPPANLFEFILFSRVAITENTAQLFGTLALSLKLALLPLFGNVFREEARG